MPANGIDAIRTPREDFRFFSHRRAKRSLHEGQMSVVRDRDRDVHRVEERSVCLLDIVPSTHRSRESLERVLRILRSLKIDLNFVCVVLLWMELKRRVGFPMSIDGIQSTETGLCVSRRSERLLH